MPIASRAEKTRLSRLIVPIGGAALLVGLAAFVVVNMFGGGTEDHYTPPTTPGDRAPLKVGEAAPDFTLPNANGEPVSLKDFRGKPTIVLFFRTFG